MIKDEYEAAWSEDDTGPIESALQKAQKSEQDDQTKEFTDAFNEGEEPEQVAGIGSWLRKKAGMETADDRKDSGTERKPTEREKQIESALKKAQA